MLPPFSFGKHKISLERASDVLCSAFEGGSDWCEITMKVGPLAWEFDSEPKVEGKHYPYDYALNEGGAVLLTDLIDDDRALLRLDAETIQKGLRILALKYPWHFEDIVEGNDDAITGDALLQCSLLGDLVYSF